MSPFDSSWITAWSAPRREKRTQKRAARDSDRHAPQFEFARQNGGFGRVPQYTLLILVWGALVAAYVIVLEEAVKEHDYLGARGTHARTRSFDVLAFFRTAFPTIHIPVIVSVLASTVPYWTMTKTCDDAVMAGTETSSYHAVHQVRSSSSVTQLFYLADRTWAGLIGWMTTCYDSFVVARPSLPWIHLTLVVSLAYLGFPLLSVAYVIESSAYWIPEHFQAAATLGGFNVSVEQALGDMYDINQWVGTGPFSAAQNRTISLGNLTVFNSSQQSNGIYLGISDASPWASGNTVLTLGVGVSSNSQLALAAIQANAVGTSASYNSTVQIPGYSIGPEAELTLTSSMLPQTQAGPCLTSCPAKSPAILR